MPNDRIPLEQHRQQAEGLRDQAEDNRQDARQILAVRTDRDQLQPELRAVNNQ